MNKHEKVQRIQSLFSEAHALLTELRSETADRVLDSGNTKDLPDIYIFWTLRDMEHMQEFMTYAMKHLKRERS